MTALHATAIFQQVSVAELDRQDFPIFFRAVLIFQEPFPESPLYSSTLQAL